MTVCRKPAPPRWAGLIFAISLVGCQAPRGPVSIKSDDPDLHIQAIRCDVQKRNQKDIPTMVLDLASDDSAIRFYAIEGLRRLTRDDFGYRYYDDEEQRAPALSRWQQWLIRRK